MGYSIKVIDRKTNETVMLREKHGIRGGTYCVGGTEYCEISITYNYAKFFYQVFPTPEKTDTTPFGQMFANNKGGIRSLYGKPIAEVIDLLRDATEKLHGEPDADYWKPTEGNARSALFKLLLLCQMAHYEKPDSDLTLTGD